MGGPNQQPPPYIPPPDNNKKFAPSDESSLDASITVVRSGHHQNYQGNLSVSAHPEEGTSVDDDMPSPAHSGSDEPGQPKITSLLNSSLLTEQKYILYLKV